MREGQCLHTRRRHNLYIFAYQKRHAHVQLHQYYHLMWKMSNNVRHGRHRPARKYRRDFETS